MSAVNPVEEVYRATLALRAVRDYQDRPVSPAHVSQILEAARWTGSSKNTQPWLFIVVTDPDRRRAVASAGRFAGPLERAPLVIVIVRTPGGSDFDMGRVAQNIMLAAGAIGVASCPVTLHDEALALEVLGVPPDHGCRWAIALGYPDELGHTASVKARGYSGRKDLGDVVRHNGF